MFMVLKLRRHIPTNTRTHAHTRLHTFTHALIFTDQTRSASINKSCKQQIEQSQNNFWASKQMYGCIHSDVMKLILKTFCRWLCLSKKTINQNAVGRISWLETCRINLNEWFLLLLQKEHNRAMSTDKKSVDGTLQIAKVLHMKNKFKLLSNYNWLTVPFIDHILVFSHQKFERKNMRALDLIERMLTSVLTTPPECMTPLNNTWPLEYPILAYYIRNTVRLKSCNEKCITTFDWWYIHICVVSKWQIQNILSDRFLTTISCNMTISWTIISSDLSFSSFFSFSRYWWPFWNHIASSFFLVTSVAL